MSDSTNDATLFFYETASENGLYPSTKGLSFSTNWWSQEWIAALESFHADQRFAKGRTAARKGEIISLKIGKGLIEARARGSKVIPYRIKIRLNVFSEHQWNTIFDNLITNLSVVGKLFNGLFPPEIEQAFQKLDLSLFPQLEDDLRTACSCPDIYNPCKHIAAVYYLIGNIIDTKPNLLFGLRGITEEEFKAILSEKLTSRVKSNEPFSMQGLMTIRDDTSDLEETITDKSLSIESKEELQSFWGEGIDSPKSIHYTPDDLSNLNSSPVESFPLKIAGRRVDELLIEGYQKIAKIAEIQLDKLSKMKK
jgi:uncharacterized Zn finger protein